MPAPARPGRGCKPHRRRPPAPTPGHPLAHPSAHPPDDSRTDAEPPAQQARRRPLPGASRPRPATHNGCPRAATRVASRSGPRFGPRSGPRSPKPPVPAPPLPDTPAGPPPHARRAAHRRRAAGSALLRSPVPRSPPFRLPRRSAPRPGSSTAPAQTDTTAGAPAADGVHTAKASPLSRPKASAAQAHAPHAIQDAIPAAIPAAIPQAPSGPPATPPPPHPTPSDRSPPTPHGTPSPPGPPGACTQDDPVQPDAHQAPHEGWTPTPEDCPPSAPTTPEPLDRRSRHVSPAPPTPPKPHARSFHRNQTNSLPHGEDIPATPTPQSPALHKTDSLQARCAGLTHGDECSPESVDAGAPAES